MSILKNYTYNKLNAIHFNLRPFNNDKPGGYPTFFYGTELFELNTNLLSKVYDIAKDVTLEDTETAKSFRMYLFCQSK